VLLDQHRRFSPQGVFCDLPAQEVRQPPNVFLWRSNDREFSAATPAELEFHSSPENSASKSVQVEAMEMSASAPANLWVYRRGGKTSATRSASTVVSNGALGKQRLAQSAQGSRSCELAGATVAFSTAPRTQSARKPSNGRLQTVSHDGRDNSFFNRMDGCDAGATSTRAQPQRAVAFPGMNRQLSTAESKLGNQGAAGEHSDQPNQALPPGRLSKPVSVRLNSSATSAQNSRQAQPTRCEAAAHLLQPVGPPRLQAQTPPAQCNGVACIPQ